MSNDYIGFALVDRHRSADLDDVVGGVDHHDRDRHRDHRDLDLYDLPARFLPARGRDRGSPLI